MRNWPAGRDEETVTDGEGAAPRRKRLTRAEARARTRQQLLDAAAGVFARKGFAGASVEEIAESAGYSTGALYFNFDSKEQLFLDLLAERRSRAVERQAAAVAEILGAGRDDGGAGGERVGEDGGAPGFAVAAESAAGGAVAAESAGGGAPPGQDAGGGAPSAALSALFATVAGRGTEAVALQAEFWLYAVRHPEAMGIVAAAARDQVEALQPLVATAMRRSGAAEDVPPEAVTRAALALFQGLVRQSRVDPESVPDDLFRQALGWLFAGLRTVSGDRDLDEGSRTRSAGT